jgi:hypothetical protein
LAETDVRFLAGATIFGLAIWSLKYTCAAGVLLATFLMESQGEEWDGLVIVAIGGF